MVFSRCFLPSRLAADDLFTKDPVAAHQNSIGSVSQPHIAAGL